MSSRDLEAIHKVSELSRTVKKDGWDLEIVIVEDGEGGWQLEVQDGAGTASCWIESFATEQAALAEALRTIEESDISEFHEPQPWKQH